MKNREIIYIILILLMCFMYSDSVFAATAKVCKYSKGNDYDVYLYQTSDGKHYAYKMSSDGNNHKIYNASLNSDVSVFSDCPGYMQIYSDNKFSFTNDKHVLKFDYKNVPYNNKDYSSWKCSYGDVVVKQNKKGLISYTIKGEYVTNNYLQLYGYSFNSGKCPGYFASKAYETDSNSLVFYKDKDTVKDMGNDPSNGYIAAYDLSDSTSSASSNDENSNTCSKDGSNCTYANELNNNSNILIFENVGYCSKLSLASEYANPSDSACVNKIGSDVDLRFRTSSYLILTYNSSNGMLVYGFLPKVGVPDTDINSRISEYKNGNAKLGYVAELFDKYSYEKISVLQSFTECENKDDDKNYCRIVDPDAINWFNFTHGINGNEYDSEPVFWKKYGVSLETLDSDKSEHPSGIGDKSDITGTATVYLCTYNDGDMIMKVNTGTSMTKISVFFPNNSNYSSGYYKYKIGEGTDDPVSWIGSDNHYGSVESGNTGAFEADLANKVCPKEVNYGATSSKSLTICYEESDCDNVGGYVGKNPVWSLGTDGNSGDEIEITDCSDLISDDLRKILNKYFTLFKIIVPILVIVLGTVDFAKAVFSNDDDMKKTQKTFIKRIIIAVAIFFIPTFVNLLMDVANTVWGWNAGTCDIEKNIDE